MTENNPNPTTPDPLTVRMVAQELGLSMTAVYTLIQCGDLRAYDAAPTSRKGTRHSYRVRRVWLDEFVNKRIIRHSHPQPQPAVPRRRRRQQSPAVSVRQYLGQLPDASS
jgi:hypothetical protein